MRKMILYLLKKRILAITIISVMLLSISVISTANTNYFNDHYHPTPVGLLTAFTYVLSISIPVYEFSFKMKKINIDQYYSLPIKRYKLYLASYIIGLIEIIIPLAITSIVTFLMIIGRDNNLHMEYSWLFLLSSIGVGIIMFTISSYLFTRANSVFDGIIFIILGSVMPLLIFGTFDALIENEKYETFYFYYTLYSEQFNIALIFDKLLVYGEVTLHEAVTDELAFNISLFITPIIALMSLFGLLFLNSKEKAELAENKSNSYFGYKTYIPTLIISLCVIIPQEPIALVATIVMGLIIYIIYNRGFKLDKYKLIAFISSSAIGIALSFLVENAL